MIFTVYINYCTCKYNVLKKTLCGLLKIDVWPLNTKSLYHGLTKKKKALKALEN